MRPKFIKLFSVFSLVLLLTSCSEDNVTETPFCDSGDFCVQIGSEQFNSNARYSTAGIGGVFGVSCFLDTTLSKDILILFHSNNFSIGTFDFTSTTFNPPNGEASLRYRVSGQDFMASSGSVIVTSLSDSFASGVFSATVNVNGNNVEMINGNFINVHY